MRNTGTKDPRAGSINIKENHLTLEHAFLMLKIRKSKTLTSIKASETAFTANMPLHTILPIKKGWKNRIWLSI
jgi:hypothetical protein